MTSSPESNYTAPMDMLVLYARPLAYPDQFVIRRWSIKPGVASPEDAVGV